MFGSRMYGADWGRFTLWQRSSMSVDKSPSDVLSTAGELRVIDIGQERWAVNQQVCHVAGMCGLSARAGVDANWTVGVGKMTTLTLAKVMANAQWPAVYCFAVSGASLGVFIMSFFILSYQLEQHQPGRKCRLIDWQGSLADIAVWPEPLLETLPGVGAFVLGVGTSRGGEEALLPQSSARSCRHLKVQSQCEPTRHPSSSCPAVIKSEKLSSQCCCTRMAENLLVVVSRPAGLCLGMEEGNASSAAALSLSAEHPDMQESGPSVSLLVLLVLSRVVYILAYHGW
ncbi:hypothetical protein B0T22DRAFT_152198 [Podospora appendiculata]|uniref:Uncharacterized protein n=1 Tax=Podospora appendiculata TaxID=314037 RepID=A0AAE0X992_9PEZI|nr:hypothetical protein B0T22DRAFT_152198 [Podospora appendiculata]